LKKDVQIAVVGKVFKPNRLKVLALNGTLNEYFSLVKWHLSFKSTSKTFLHRNGYEEAKRGFDLNTALIQTARDKAVETLKSFEEHRKKDRVLNLKKSSIRFDKRCYGFSKTINILTPYWLTLSLNRRARISLPIVFGERQRGRIEEALQGKWKFTVVEMVKRDSEWYAHFVLGKTVEFTDEPETVIAVDRGEKNFSVAVAILKDKPNKLMKGQFWNGAEIKRIRGLYSHVRRKLQKKKLLKKIKVVGRKEKRKVNQQLHIMANQVVEYAKQFPNPIMAMENLKGIRRSFKKSKKINRCFHSLPFRKLQTYIDYKANIEGIETRYLTRKETRNTSKECHRCGYVTRKLRGRTYGCPNCGMEYDRDLNAAINIAHRVMNSMGWRSCEPLEPAGDARTQRRKGRLNAESPLLQ